MKQLCWAAALLMSSSFAADLTGTWDFSVDLKSGDHGDPVFELKQSNTKITGTYSGPFGEQPLTGEVKGDAVTLEVAASSGGGTLRLTYNGTLESDGKMSGTMTRNISGKSTPGQWTAVRRK